MEELERDVTRYYNQIRTSELSPAIRETLSDVFMSWIEQRFSEKGKKEIEEMMIGILPDLRETQSGKDLIQIGRLEGRSEGRSKGKIEGKIEGLVLQMEAKFGPLDAMYRERISQLKSEEKIDQLLLQVINVSSIDQLRW